MRSRRSQSGLPHRPPVALAYFLQRWMPTVSSMIKTKSKVNVLIKFKCKCAAIMRRPVQWGWSDRANSCWCNQPVGGAIWKEVQRNFYGKVTFLFICLQLIMVLTSVHAQPVTWLTGTVQLKVIQRRLCDYHRANLFLYRIQRVIKALCNGVIFMIFCSSSKRKMHKVLKVLNDTCKAILIIFTVVEISVFLWWSKLSNQLK